jgi:hypothetical protein
LNRRSVIDPFSQDPQARQARLGLRLAQTLSVGASRLAPDVNERLRFAREKALARAREQRQAVAAGAVRTGPASLALQGGPSWWLRALGLGPLLLLVVGLALVQHWSQREQILAAADVDAILLADDLPPKAYSDPGFAEYLRSEPP